jgi:D-sedoheptulose 7-phosphate isomerase
MIENSIKSSIDTKQKILNNKGLLLKVQAVADKIIECYRQDGKVLFCGNGGSAADAQHLSAELSGRYYFDRPPLYAEALHANTSYLTAVANDYSFNDVYSRLVIANGRKGDVLVALSTSGNSQNIINAIEQANKIGMFTVGLTGESGGKMKNACQTLLNIPSSDTPRIQESHILIGHIICEIVESTIFPK